jgi:hypothetical protein
MIRKCRACGQPLSPAPTPPPGWLSAACGLSGLALLALYRRAHVADVGKSAKRRLRAALVCALASYAWAWWICRYPFF